MTKVAFLGLGAMGRRMAANLLKAGHELTVWNRTASAAEGLGARRAETPREAAAQAEVVIAMLRDDEASHQVWLDAETGALSGMKPGAVAVESSTLSVQGVRTLAAAMEGRAFIEAPVSGSLPAAEAGELVYLIGGEEAAWRLAEPVLKAMGVAQHHLGVVGSAALAKLATNALMGVQLTALAEIIGIAEHNGADPAKILGAVAGTKIWSPVAGGLTASMLAGNFTPQFPVTLIEKDFGYALKAAGSVAHAPVLAAARNVFETAIERGLGDLNMTSVVKLNK